MVRTTWRQLLLLALAVCLAACSSIDFSSYNWAEDPRGWLNKYRVYHAQDSNDSALHWVITEEEIQQIGLLPLSLDPRLTDSYPGTRLKQKNTVFYQPSLSYSSTGRTILLAQLQPEMSAQLHHLLATAPGLDNRLPWDTQHKPDVFWGKPSQFRFVNGAFRYNYLDCAFPISAPCSLLPQPAKKSDANWQLDGYLTNQSAAEDRYLLVMNWNPETSLYEREDRFNLDIKPTRRLLGALSDELGVSHWLMLQLSVADFDHWLKADANGDYQHDFVLQALLLDTAGRVQQAKISPFTLRWSSTSLLLSEEELAQLQHSWLPALLQVLHAFGLQRQEQHEGT
ncbi:hypothetical protein Q3O59_08385 [Alkalimonas delamerensis]|uniref:Uncharacterized protein n=1 Tax=Alkalimonas delamerensis TaxID=265981 RepID=A0ABT9GQV9_9GAMM|nr:hypothetical protein [Alkalimonas delamerensis]MDP4529046.1 hypothetical protein [Alkalimonas delamerensis]